MKRIRPRDSRNIFFKNGRWWVRIRVNGKRYHREAGATEAQARAFRDKLKAWKRDINLGIPARQPEGQPIRFEAFADDYLKLYAKAKRSYDRDELSVAHLKEFFGGVLLRDINAEAVDRYRASRKVSVRTVNLELACLRTILYLAVRYGKLAAYPLPTKGLLKREAEFKPRVLELEEARRLVEVADPRFLRDALIVFLGTGLRLRELLNLPRRDVDFKRAELTITSDRAKNGHERTVPLGPRVVEVLKSRPGRDYFFENPNTAQPIRDINAAWRTAKESAEIKGRLRIHDLRDTFATWLLRAGKDIRTVAAIIGDSPEITLRRYCHTDARMMRAAVQDLPDLTSQSGPKVNSASAGEPATSPELVN